MPEFRSHVLDYLYRALGSLPLPRRVGLLHHLGGLSVSQPRHFERSFHGLRYRGLHDQLIDRHVWLFGEYAPSELRFLDFAARALGRARGQAVYLDAGANVGHHSLYMAARAQKVLAFEPSPAAARQFASNIELNGLGNIQLFVNALGDADGEAALGSGLHGNSGSRSLNWSLNAAASETVQVKQGDGLLASIAAPRIDLMKMDVEGYEKRVMLGLARRLRADRPVIMFELLGGETKGGFTSEQDLRDVLYPDCQLYSLPGKGTLRLEPFLWEDCEGVCIPNELAEDFAPLTPPLPPHRYKDTAEQKDAHKTGSGAEFRKRHPILSITHNLLPALDRPSTRFLNQ